jgi:hypothetical protein
MILKFLATTIDKTWGIFLTVIPHIVMIALCSLGIAFLSQGVLGVVITLALGAFAHWWNEQGQDWWFWHTHPEFKHLKPRGKQ